MRSQEILDSPCDVCVLYKNETQMIIVKKKQLLLILILIVTYTIKIFVMK